MNLPKRRAFIALSLLALPGRAAVHYRFTTEGRGGLLPVNRSGSVFVDGIRARIETKGKSLDSVRLWGAEGQACLHLDPARKTYYKSGCGLDDVVRFATRPEKAPKIEKVKVKARDEGEDAGTLAGFNVRKGTIDVSWDTEVWLGAEWFPVTIQRRIEVWMTDRLSVPAFPFGHLQELKSGVVEVDSQVSESLKKLGSFPLKQVLTTTRAFDRNHPTTEVLTTILSDVADTPSEPSLFEVPAGYRLEEPVVAAPGGH